MGPREPSPAVSLSAPPAARRRGLGFATSAALALAAEAFFDFAGAFGIDLVGDPKTLSSLLLDNKLSYCDSVNKLPRPGIARFPVDGDAGGGFVFLLC